MRYLAFQREAVEEIVGNRRLQSIDFEEGSELLRILSGELDDISGIAPRLSLHTSRSGAGKIVTYAGGGIPAYVVFDLDESGVFDPKQPSFDAVQILQRVLRFAIKHWDHKILNPSEMVFPAYKKAIIFPFPISQKTGFRVAIDLNPDASRLERRGQAERYLLVYKAGLDDGKGPGETPSFTVFRKFLDDLPHLDVSRKPAGAGAAQISALQGVSVGPPPGRLDIHQGYDLWMRALTSEQRRFVVAPLESPARIEGPAGTGKTLCLALKAVHSLKGAQEKDLENSSLFVTHSEASRKSILDVLESMDAGHFLRPLSPRRALKVVTLQGLCAEILRQEISATELLDPDAYDAKQLQLLYVEQALEHARRELTTYQKFLSVGFSEFLSREEDWALMQMLQHEIGVVIKGRANEKFDSYSKVPPLKNGLPLQNEGDKSFVWRVYELYRDQLISGAQFDTDDVMLSALGQLATPIWRRRRLREGYDCIFIDETHLFNMNELSVFHHLTKRDDRYQIAFAVDRSQAIGDRGWANDVDFGTLVPDTESLQNNRTKVSTVFRCSPDIVNLAFTVTSSGASLFTNFEDPLLLANSNLSFEEERMCQPPVYTQYDDDESLVKGAFEQAEDMVKSMSTSRGDIAIIAFGEELFKLLTSKAESENKPIELLKERGNLEVIKKARQSGRFVLSMPDYVGGLEFDGVVIVGVDDGRVPSTSGVSAESRAFLSFTAHNRLYVAITRARYRVIISGVKARGPSEILNPALKQKAIELKG
ncbi:UvrD-helicase domain-containing protein [Rhizobium cremeum]|uniref:UvrD-helicase domain-containing protein n=1 Tax=Rhizobium cremeum TaxID=2813827 RepID=UPI001FD44693|nr:UvrD-helicase domain-containing protein [Rhizobium cremeum]MCJ7993432.1 UvrD-helicase domain-containing protein [Rhizobium cremeum]MCJ8003094.1 UvrD-helicase domain-containing protein [Rhizobium cremeum]